jgi:hypothetical protein
MEVLIPTTMRLAVNGKSTLSDMLEANVKQTSCGGNYPIKLGHNVEENITVGHMLNVKE